MDQWIAVAREAQALPWVRALEVVAGSVLLATIVDQLISRFVLRMTKRTTTDLDDRIPFPQRVVHMVRPPAKSS